MPKVLLAGDNGPSLLCATWGAPQHGPPKAVNLLLQPLHVSGNMVLCVDCPSAFSGWQLIGIVGFWVETSFGVGAAEFMFPTPGSECLLSTHTILYCPASSGPSIDYVTVICIFCLL